MYQPRNIFVFAVVFLVLAVLPIIPVTRAPDMPDYEPNIVFISYIQIVNCIFQAKVQYQFEVFTLVTVAVLLVVGIIAANVIIQRMETER